MATEWDSEWDRLEAIERGEAARGNVVPISDDMPEWMNDMNRYGEADKPLQPLPLIDPSAWANSTPPERRWKVKDYIPDGQATLLTGKGAAGKSLVSQLKATCIALGMPFLGLEVEQANALYITCEDDQDELHRRQAAICDSLGVPVEALSGKLFLLSLQGQLGNELATFSTDGRMTVAPRFEQIEAACLEHGIGFLTLDNTAHLFTGNENDRHQVASFINLCNRLATTISGAVVIVGHPNKAGDSYSGSTAWENQVRSRLFMEIPTNEQGEITDPDIRVLRREKVNYAQRGGELRFMWFKGSFVLPDAVPTSGTHLAETMADTRDNGIFIACLKERNRQFRAVSEQNSSRTYAPKVMAKMPESRGIGEARLERAMDRLFRINAIERGFLWVMRGEGKSAHGLRLVANSDDVPMTSNPEKKSSEIKPMTSDDLNGAECAKKHSSDDMGGHREIQQNQTDDLPMTSDDSHPLDTTYLEGGGPLGAGHPLIDYDRTDDFSNDDQPPAWMDDVPPWEPGDDAPRQSGADWLENPMLNPDWQPPTTPGRQ